MRFVCGCVVWVFGCVDVRVARTLSAVRDVLMIGMEPVLIKLTSVIRFIGGCEVRINGVGSRIDRCV